MIARVLMLNDRQNADVCDVTSTEDVKSAAAAALVRPLHARGTSTTKRGRRRRSDTPENAAVTGADDDPDGE